MKRILSITLCMMLFAALSLGTYAFVGENYTAFSSTSKVDYPTNEHIAGDANGDGKIGLLDAIAVLRYCVDDYKNTLRDGVDVNSDGEVNPLDAILLVNYIIGNNSDLGVLVDGDGNIKEEADADFEDATISVTVVTAEKAADKSLSKLNASGKGIFLGWFASEEAATALDTEQVATDDFAGTVYGAFADATFKSVGADMFCTEPYGIRFTSNIDKALICAVEKVNVLNNVGENSGFVPFNEWKTGVGFGTALAIDVAVDGIASKVDGKAVTNGVCVPAVYFLSEDSESITYSATVIGVTTSEMADKIAARPYITYYDANGALHTVYADGQSESFYNVTKAVADSPDATDEAKTAAAALIKAYTGGFSATLTKINAMNLSSVEGSADNDNAYVELDRTTLVTLDGEADDGKTGSDRSGVYRYENAFYPRITKVNDSLYLMTFNYSQLGRHIYYTTSTDGKDWTMPKVLYSADNNKLNDFTYENGPLAGTTEERLAATADHCVLDNGTVMCVYSRRPRNGYNLAEYAGVSTIEMVIGTVSGSTITWSEPVSIYYGQNWEPEIIQRKNGDIEVYWSHSAPMLQLYGFHEDMRSSGVAMISSSDGGKTWTPNVTKDDTNLYAGKRIYQYNAGKFTVSSGEKVNFYHGQMPGVVELCDGRMMVVAETRTTSRNYHMISLARSNSDGTWNELGIDEAGPVDVDEDNFKGAAPTLMRFDSGELLVTYNAAKDGSNMMYARLLNKTGSDIAEAYELNPFYATSETDSGFWSASAPVDSHTAILAMCYKKYQGREFEYVTNDAGEEDQLLHNTTVIGKVRLNHTIDATEKNMVADGNPQEWKNITDALFVGSLSSAVQATYRFAYDDDYIYVAIDRVDNSNNAADTNYVLVATADGYIRAEISYGAFTLPEGVTGTSKTSTGGRFYELCFDRAALGLTGDHIRVNPGFTDYATGIDDRINGTLLSDTSSWLKINLK